MCQSLCDNSWHMRLRKLDQLPQMKRRSAFQVTGRAYLFKLGCHYIIRIVTHIIQCYLFLITCIYYLHQCPWSFLFVRWLRNFCCQRYRFRSRWILHVVVGKVARFKWKFVLTCGVKWSRYEVLVIFAVSSIDKCAQLKISAVSPHPDILMC